MVRFATVRHTLLIVAALAVPTLAARPATELLPATTKGLLSIPDVDELRSRWDDTQIGKLSQDPVMKPFADDLRQQLKDKITKTGIRLGITLDDLEGVYGGEVSLAVIQPGEKQHAMAIVVDVTDHIDAATELLKKIETNLTQRGATRTAETVAGTELTIFQMPKEKDSEKSRQVVFYIKDDQLVAIDHLDIAKQMLARFEGDHTDTLESVPAFAAVMLRCQQASDELAPNVRWFIEPFGFAEVVRAAQGGRKKRGTDMLKVLANQGFHAIQAIGGHLNLATGEHELLHRTMVYAPAVKRQEEDESTDKFDLAARMLDFPNQSQLTAQPWVPRELATYGSFHWKMRDAFEHSKTLVDEVAGDEGFFEDLLTSIATDPNGPQIDVRKELVVHLGDRATLMSDYVLPITPKSERLMFAVAVTNADAVADMLNKAMESDPDARKLEIDGQVIFEIINEPDQDVPQLEINAPGFGPIVEEPAVEEEEERLLPNSAITVLHGHLIVATHVDFLTKIMGPLVGKDPLADTADYKLINTHLTKLGAGEDSFRFFTRTDEEYRPSYELIRQGKMPESETLLGRLLNRLLGPEEEGVLRDQQVDGKNLPEYQIVRRYLGPAGLYVHSEDDGWFLSGLLLNKQAETVEDQDGPAITTASAESADKEKE